MESFSVRKNVNDIRDRLISLSDKIWESPETRFEEYRSSAMMKEMMISEGFIVEEATAGIDTAFIATFGSGKPVIGILAEYDALSGMSQVPGIASREPVQEGGNGHGCGHNLLGASSIGAAIVAKKYLEQTGKKGTVQLIGCPGEEGGSGKAFMAREGVFDILDAAITWHPSTVNFVMSMSMLANYQVYFRFTGVTSHAAASPHLGRSALDAVELMNVGVNYLREHIISEAKVHYAVTNTGGKSPNVVQGNAEVLYLIRAPKMNQVKEIFDRVCDVAKGAALMTGTKVDVVFDKACSNVIPNRAIEKIMQDNLEKAGGPDFDNDDVSFAEAIRETLSEAEREKDAFLGMLPQSRQLEDRLIDIQKNPLSSEILPYIQYEAAMPGSSDVGDVSWVTPTSQFMMSCFALGTPGHSWQMVSQGKTGIAHKGMIKASEVLAMTAIDLFSNCEIVEQAKEEHRKSIGIKGYECPVMKGVNPSTI